MNLATTPNLSGFDDMESDLDFGAPAPTTSVEEHVARVGKALANAATAVDLQSYVEPCKRCGGSGVYRAPSSYGRDCFLCKGTGKQFFKTSPEQRAKTREQAAARKQRQGEQRKSMWAEQHPTEHAWLVAKAPSFNFALDMLANVQKWGSLTDGQMAAVRRMRDADAERDAKRAQAQAAAAARPVERLNALHTVLQRHAKFYAGDVTISRRNGDQLCWIKHKDAEKVIGKIDNGVLTLWNRPGVDTTAVRGMLEEFEGAPLQTAMKYGKLAGVCCSCGRELTNDGSIEAGIGPVCARKFEG